MNHCWWGRCKRKKEGRARAKPSARAAHSIRSPGRRRNRHCLWILQGTRIKRLLNLNSGLSPGRGTGIQAAWWVLWQSLFSDSIRMNLTELSQQPQDQQVGSWSLRGWDANSNFSVTFSVDEATFQSTCYKSFLKLSSVWGSSSMYNTSQTQVETQPALGISLKVKVALKPARNVPHI